jgi:hypothetical protein
LVLPCRFEGEWERQGDGVDCEICRVGIEMIGVDNPPKRAEQCSVITQSVDRKLVHLFTLIRDKKRG